MVGEELPGKKFLPRPLLKSFHVAPRQGTGVARRRTSPVRLAVILAVGVACMAAAHMYRRSRRPAPAPPDVQQQGIRQVQAILAKVAGTGFGQSRRGRILSDTITRFIARGRLIFAADIGPQALYRREFLGFEALYVKAMVIGGRLTLRDDEIMAEGVFHEAVHAARGGSAAASLEEECDGFAAGLCAAAAVAGTPLPDLLLLEGRPVAEFVKRVYPTNPRCPSYQPVGESPEWLRRRTGLK